MASIDNLNFAVILDDKNFKKQIEADLKLAKDFNIQLSDAFDLRRSGMGDAPKLLRQYQQRLDALMKSGKKLTEEQRQERENLKQLIRLYQRQVINISNAEARQQRYARTVRETTSEMDRQSRYLSQMTNMIKTATSAYAAKEIIGDMIRITGEFEMQRVALRSILQDMTGADALYEKIQALAVESPFQFKDLISYTKQLAAFSVPLDELYDTTKMLADVSAGLGVGMDRLILAYGQIRSAAFLRGTEVRQLTEAGVPILEELRRKFEELGETGITVGDVFDRISARMVPFEMVKEVFEDMTSAGGMFYQMQEVQAQTLAGKISNLKDAYEVMFAEIGGKSEGILKNSIDLLRRLMQNYEEVGREIVALVGTYGLYRVALTAATYHTTLLARAQITLAAASRKMTAAIAANPYALIAAAVAAVGYAVYRLAVHQTKFEKLMKSVNETVAEFSSTVASEISGVDYLFGRLGKLTAGTQEYNEVRSQILKDYGTYLTEQDKEAIAVGQLTDAYERLKVSLTEANKEKFLQQGSADISEQFGNVYENIFKTLQRIFKRNDIMKGDQLAIADYVFGRTDSLSGDFLNYATTAQLQHRFKRLREQYMDMAEWVDMARDRLAEGLRLMYGAPEGTPPPVLSGWQEALQGFLKDLGETERYAWWTDDKKNSKYYEYVDSVRERWTQIGKQIEDAGKYNDDLVASMRTEQSELEQIAKFLGFDINTDKNGGSGDDITRRWRIQVQWLQELQKQYQALSQYADNATLSPLFMGRYGKDINSTLSFLPEDRRMSILVDFDFEDNLLYMASEIRKVGTDAALALAEQIERSVGGDWASVQEGLFKAVRDYADFIKEWGGQDFMLDGKGVAFDLSKIATDYNNAISKVAKTRDEAIKKAAEAAKKNGTEWYQQELTHIAALYGRQMDYEKKLREEKIRDLGENYAKEMIAQNPSIITDDIASRSIGVLRSSLESIEALRSAGITEDMIPENFRKLIDEGTLSIEGATEAYDTFLDKLSGETKLEMKEKEFERLTNSINGAADALSKIGTSISSIGSETGNAALETLGDSLSEAAVYVHDITDALSSAAEFKLNDKNGVDISFDPTTFLSNLASGLLSSLVNTLFNVIANAIIRVVTQQERANEALREYQQTLRELGREDYDTIFGTDEWGRLKYDIQQANDALNKYNDSVKKAEADNYTYYGGLSWSKGRHSALDTLANRAGVSMDEFYNNGILDIEKVRSYYEQFADDMPKKQRQVFEEMLNNQDELTKYMEYTAEYLSSLFGGLGDEITDIWYEAWTTMGNDAESTTEKIRDSLYSIGEDMVKQMMKAIFLQPIFDKYQSYFQDLVDKNAMGEISDEEYLRLVGQGMNDLAEDIDANTQAAMDFLDMAENYDVIPEGGTGNSIDTIQGNLSEETMNRVLNIVNAMRAEQFRQGMRIDNIDVTLVSIAGLLGESRDQYLNYLAQISANTANTTQRIESVLDCLESVAGYSTGLAFKVRVVN